MPRLRARSLPRSPAGFPARDARPADRGPRALEAGPDRSELLKAAEAVRSATALQVRALRGGDPDQDMLEQLDENIAEAAKLYRRVGGFENELRGLAGHREAIRLRLEAVKTGGTIDVPIVVTTSDGKPLPSPGSKPGTWRLTTEQYFTGVPTRFRDPDRFAVQRCVKVNGRPLDGNGRLLDASQPGRSRSST